MYKPRVELVETFFIINQNLNNKYNKTNEKVLNKKTNLIRKRRKRNHAYYLHCARDAQNQKRKKTRRKLGLHSGSLWVLEATRMMPKNTKIPRYQRLPTKGRGQRNSQRAVRECILLWACLTLSGEKKEKNSEQSAQSTTNGAQCVIVFAVRSPRPGEEAWRGVWRRRGRGG